MNDNTYSSLSNAKNVFSLKNSIRILKYFNKKDIKFNHSTKTFLDKYNKRKNNTLLISNLLNSSKKLVKSNSCYKSYTDLPKSFQYNYPYRPPRLNCNRSVNDNQKSKKDSISAYTSIDNKNELSKIQSSRNILSRKKFFKIHLKNFSFYTSVVNEAIFFDFIDGYNIKTNNKEKYNNYILNHPMDNDNELNIFQLYDMLKNFKVDYNDNNFFNDKSTYKINKFKLKNNLSVKIKISSLKLIFYKVKQRRKYHFNDTDYSFDDINNSVKPKNKNIQINKKIRFPFGFLPFFFGLNIIEFLRFLITIVDYDYSKNTFYIDDKKFTKNYKLFEKANSFFGDSSFYQQYLNKEKEYFIYDWDVKNKDKTIHYMMKILLPQIKISLGFENNTICKFFYSLGINRIIYLIKEKFQLWDFHILKYFSEFKIFRQEVNRIICDKLPYRVKSSLSCKNNNYNRINIINTMNKNILNENIKTNICKRKYNFNKINVKMNKTTQNENSFEFFFSRNINIKNEVYFFQIQIPKIHVKYYFQNLFLEKYFDLDIKRMSQINKLRKCFQIEDIIKYSMVIIDQKDKTPQIRKSFYEKKQRRSFKRSSTFKNYSASQKLNLKNASIRTSLNNSNNSIFMNSRDNNLRRSNFMSSLKNLNNETTNKDIKLNLDKYIFNFDEDILKFIKPLPDSNKNSVKQEKNKIENKRKTIKGTNKLNNKNAIQMDQTKLNVDLGRIKLIWNTNEFKENVYFFEEKESEFLLENQISVWEKYIESNFDEFKAS